MTRTHDIVPGLPEGDACPCGASVEHALQMLEGRWKASVLARLSANPTLRFSELRRAIANVSPKMLTEQLRELEGDGLVRRTVFPEVPPRVEYALTADGHALIPALRALREWADTRTHR